jgi:hypothetical protein
MRALQERTRCRVLGGCGRLLQAIALAFWEAQDPKESKCVRLKRERSATVFSVARQKAFNEFDRLRLFGELSDQRCMKLTKPEVPPPL